MYDDAPLLRPGFPWHQVALLVVDVQNGFCHPASSFGQQNDLRPIVEAVPRIVELVRACRQAGLPIIWSQEEHLPQDFGQPHRVVSSHFDRGLGRPCLRGTWEVDVVPELAAEVQPEDLRFTKRRASCFYGTSLECDLRMLGVTGLIVCGVTTNFCVEMTIRDASMRDLEVIVPADCCAGVYDDLHQATLRNAALYFGHVTSLDEIRRALGGRPSSSPHAEPAVSRQTGQK